MSAFEKKVTDQMNLVNQKVDDLVRKTNEEVENHGKIGIKNADALRAVNDTVEEVQANLLELEQKYTAKNDTPVHKKTPGEQFVDSDAWAAYKGGTMQKVSVEVQNNTVTTGGAQVQPEHQAGVVPGAFRRLRIADSIMSGRTSSNAVEYTRENVFTNNAAETAEGAVKPESDITFELVTAPVATIAHRIKMSKQMVDDAPLVASYIDTRMRYGVELRYDQQLMIGDGTSPNISGILDVGNFTVFVPQLGDSVVESVRKAITQVQLADYEPTVIYLNPIDVERIDLDQDSTGVFLVSDPRAFNTPVIWGLPIVVSNSVPSGQFAMGAVDVALQRLERQDVTVEIFEQDEDNVSRNLLTMRAEQRSVLQHYRPASMVGGPLTAP